MLDHGIFEKIHSMSPSKRDGHQPHGQMMPVRVGWVNYAIQTGVRHTRMWTPFVIAGFL